ncbi:unnamed protein product [Bemisia tabaci]|uniref:palmitoyl-CoA hydrolase n=1 Tax=Bemisia tabaci TaxID=7038 RepID=A0A9P0ALA2_BEMTA|nr:unnamed protein product [Bemisia tabaci]
MLLLIHAALIQRLGVFLVLFSAISVGDCYKPVFLVHGILSSNRSMEALARRIEEKHPGTKTYVSDRFLKWSSLEPIWRQISRVGEDFKNISDSHPDGFHVIGYSQGGLIARGLLELFPKHNVHTFVSLSSPQAGQYGDSFLHLIFPNLVCATAYELFYSKIGQTISVGNYWNDPYHQKLFFKYSSFLPFLNNMIKSDFSDQFKEGISKLKNMVLIGGPDDGVITPWQSSHFGYFNEDGAIINFKDRTVYINDTMGLQTLDSQNKLQIITLSNVSHFNWHRNHTVTDDFILPWLD